MKQKLLIPVISLTMLLSGWCYTGVPNRAEVLVPPPSFISPSADHSTRTNQNEIPSDTIIVKNDTLFLMNSTFPEGETNIVKCTGNINDVEIFHIGRTKKESPYVYCIGSNPDRDVSYHTNSTTPQLTVLLLKDFDLVATLDFQQYFTSKIDVYLSNPEGLSLAGTDEILELQLNQPFCGGIHDAVYFFRSGDKLIKGVNTSNYGEPGTEYFYQTLIAPSNNQADEIWVENEVGKTKVGKGAQVFFTELEKYVLKNDSLIRLNPKKDDVYFVTALNGLQQRTEPNSTSEPMGLLPYKSKVNVLNKTNIETTVMDNGKPITGHWVQVEWSEGYYEYSTFVFDGFLSKEEPEK